jgi:hypothetical protein
VSNRQLDNLADNTFTATPLLAWLASRFLKSLRRDGNWMGIAREEDIRRLV